MKKSAVITGASSGIGEELAYAFAEKGYDLILTCRSSMDALTAIANNIREKYKVEATPVLCDGCYMEAVEALFQDIDQIDVLVNNAGISYVGLLQDMTEEEWNHVISTNLSSVFRFSKHAIPLMLKTGSGSIINISSVWGTMGASMEVAYSASKGGVNSFTKALAKELAPSHIRVNAISCGYIDTSMNDHLTPEEKQMLFNEIPAGRPGSAKEIATFATSLADAPEYLTGQVITMDGAWT